MTQALAQARKALEAIVDTLDAEEMGEGPPASQHVAHWQKLHEDAQSALAAIDAALEGGAVPKVKALEWQRESPTEWKPETWKAESLLGEYDIQRERDGTFSGFAPNVGTGIFPTLEAARAEAQADYERRILSALDLPSPPTGA